MNSCILTAEIIKNPELRSTPDNQMEIASMFVQFAPPLGSRTEDTRPTIEVIGWGGADREDSLAKDIKENYKQGDWVTIEGRLEMNTIERDGFKEKRARLVASKVYRIAPMDASPAPKSTAAPKSASAASSRPAAAKTPRVEEAPSFDATETDEIPF